MKIQAGLVAQRKAEYLEKATAQFPTSAEGRPTPGKLNLDAYANIERSLQQHSSAQANNQARHAVSLRQPAAMQDPVSPNAGRLEALAYQSLSTNKLLDAPPQEPLLGLHAAAYYSPWATGAHGSPTLMLSGRFMEYLQGTTSGQRYVRVDPVDDPQMEHLGLNGVLWFGPYGAADVEAAYALNNPSLVD